MQIRYRMWLFSQTAVLAGLLLVSCGPDRSDVNLETALKQLREVAVAPQPSGTSDMISSYDRMGGNADWGDLKQLWIGGDRYVLADLKGPGCVRRMWMTNVNAEEWLFYFDDEKEPRIRCSERVLFSQDGSGRFPFLPPLADMISGGAFNYLPFPYRKSLRIVVRIPKTRPDSRPYFHVNYETYPAGTKVASFPKSLSAADKSAIQDTIARWDSVEEGMRAVLGRLAFEPRAVPSGGTVVVYEAAGSAGVIATLAVRLNAAEAQNAVEQARNLRYLVLRCFWDGAETPSVEVPLGDFFCNGLQPRRFASLAMADVDGAWICRFPMPYRKGARIEIRNDGPQAVSLGAAVEMGAGDSAANRYFHASWNQATNGGKPFRIMRTEGKGEFMGCYLIAHGADGGWNILEGDEQFFRDGDLRPVHHGTGLEDYFNSGWYYYGLFERPLHGLLEKAAMRTSQYRFQIPDPVTFEKNLQMIIEFGDANQARGYMSAAAYWYQDKPGPAGSGMPPADQRFPGIERVGVAASMCEIFELERAGLDREAEQRSDYYAALFGGDVLGQMYALRALAYKEIREGSDAVRDAYKAIAEKGAPEVAEQAKLLLWRSEKPHRALFGGGAYSSFRLFADGQKVGEGGHPFIFQAFPVELEAGPHTLRAEIESKGDQSWYTLGFSSDFTNVVSDISWDYAVSKPEGWPASDGDPALWKPYAVSQWFFPSMQWWQLAPNAFPCVQSGQQVGGPFTGWEKPSGRVIYLRRRIVVPAETGPWVNPLIRSKALRTPAVRPAGDKSNEGLRH